MHPTCRFQDVSSVHIGAILQGLLSARHALCEPLDNGTRTEHGHSESPAPPKFRDLLVGPTGFEPVFQSASRRARPARCRCSNASGAASQRMSTAIRWCWTASSATLGHGRSPVTPPPQRARRGRGASPRHRARARGPAARPRQLEPADASAPPDPLSEPSPVLAGLVSASVQGWVALGPRPGARVRRVGDAPAVAHGSSRGPRQAHRDGVALPARVWVPPNPSRPPRTALPLPPRPPGRPGPRPAPPRRARPRHAQDGLARWPLASPRRAHRAAREPREQRVSVL